MIRDRAEIVLKPPAPLPVVFSCLFTLLLIIPLGVSLVVLPNPLSSFLYEGGPKCLSALFLCYDSYTELSTITC